MESYVMTVTCVPTLSAVARIVSVLHARRAPISGLGYSDGAFAVDLQGGDPVRLAAHVRRVVGVTSVQLSGRRPAAVAS